jgi:hypothetical protein
MLLLSPTSSSAARIAGRAGLLRRLQPLVRAAAAPARRALATPAAPQAAPRARGPALLLAAASLAAGAGLAWAGAPELATRLSAAPAIPADAAAADGEVTVEPATRLPLPRHLHVPALHGCYALLGTGVRQVTFIAFNAYALGLYAEVDGLQALLRGGGDAAGQPAGGGGSEARAAAEEALARRLLASRTPLLAAVLPARATDGAHLRSGFLRLWQAQLDAALRAGELGESEGKVGSASARPCATLPVS